MKVQHGSTLIIVLIILLLITIVGTIAIKSSILGLGIATNNQINTLLRENSDAALFNIENPNEKKIARQLAQDGMFNYFNSADNSQDQLVFCFRASENDFFAMNRASAITPNGSTTKIGVQGFCQANQFATGRSAMLSQVYITKNTDADDTPFSSAIKGSSLGQSDLPQLSLNLHASVISILPSFTSATSTQIQSCFRRSMESVTTCFDNLNMPYNMQSIDFKAVGQLQLES